MDDQKFEHNNCVKLREQRFHYNGQFDCISW